MNVDKFIRHAVEAVDHWSDNDVAREEHHFGGKPGTAVPEVDPEHPKDRLGLRKQIGTGRRNRHNALPALHLESASLGSMNLTKPKRQPMRQPMRSCAPCARRFTQLLSHCPLCRICGFSILKQLRF